MPSIQKERLLYHLSWVLVLLLAFIVVFGSYFMPYHITDAYKIALHKETVNGVVTMTTPPLAPSSEHWLGTDHRGYDVLSLLLNGAKYTIGFALVATLLRFLLAVPVGLFAGARDRGRKLIATLQMITSSVPPLLFLFPTMYGLKQVLPQESQDLVLFLLVILLGVFQLMNQFAERAQFYSEKLFVAAAKTLGASTSRIVFRHLVPHLRPELLFAFLADFAQVLFLLGQLAVVNIFLRGGEPYIIDLGPPLVRITLTLSGEWGGMITYGIKTLRSYPWILISSGLFLTISILILMFFSSQLQKRIARPYLYSSQPLLQNKPLLATYAAISIATVALLTFTTSKAPAPVPVQTAETETNQSATQPTLAPTATDPAEEAGTRKSINKQMKQFFGYLQDNRWDYASYLLYTENSALPINQTPSEPPFPPFDKWLPAVASKQYQFTDIGTIAPGDGDTYQVELKIQGPSGLESWYMITGPPRKSGVALLGGLGGPAAK